MNIFYRESDFENSIDDYSAIVETMFENKPDSGWSAAVLVIRNTTCRMGLREAMDYAHTVLECLSEKGNIHATRVYKEFLEAK